MTEVTSVPSRIREVAAAAAVSVGQAPYQGPDGSPVQVMWSYVHAES